VFCGFLGNEISKRKGPMGRLLDVVGSLFANKLVILSVCMGQVISLLITGTGKN